MFRYRFVKLDLNLNLGLATLQAAMTRKDFPTYDFNG